MCEYVCLGNLRAFEPSVKRFFFLRVGLVDLYVAVRLQRALSCVSLGSPLGKLVTNTVFAS